MPSVQIALTDVNGESADIFSCMNKRIYTHTIEQKIQYDKLIIWNVMGWSSISIYEKQEQ